MQLAKTAIKLIHAYTLHIAPINRLPAELIARIFHLVRDGNDHSMDRAGFICSRWRTIALQDSSLWTWIDIYPSFRKPYPSLSRAKAHSLRSDEMPLEVYVWGALDPERLEEKFIDTPMRSLCQLAAPRMSYLGISGDFRPRMGQGSICSVISILLSHCSPGVLNSIVTSSRFGGFFASFGDGDEEASFGAQAITRLEMTNLELEASFARVTVLNLTGVFPSWANQAYYGLVELRLTSHASTGLLITERQLISILKSSSGLRITQLCFWITDLVEETNAFVSLPNLEVLQVDAEAAWGIELVRFLQSGLSTSLQHGM
ncbi:hypothetical protein B0J17DRAFT_718442 [Rhizoctonia solani]|nr:hypothetical protein B0J17DRAFT_718442 [Rhizoctonia solani]